MGAPHSSRATDILLPFRKVMLGFWKVRYKVLYLRVRLTE